MRRTARAYAALANLKELGSQGQLNVEQVAVVTRDDDGRIEVKARVGDDILAGTASGGLVGVLSKTVQVGRTALLAHAVEPSPEVVDSAMARLSGTAVRRPVYEVEAEIAEVQEAQREAKKPPGPQADDDKRLI